MKRLNQTIFSLTAAVGLFFSAQSLAGAFNIDFSDVSAGLKTDPFQIIDPAGFTATFSATALNGADVTDFAIYDSEPGGGNDPDLASPFYDAQFRNDTNPTQAPRNLGNIGIIQSENEVGNGPDDRAGGGIITVEFSTGITLFDILVVDASLGSGGPVKFEMTTETGVVTRQTTFNADTNTPPNFYEKVSLDADDVTKLVITMGINGGVSGGIDEIRGTFIEEGPRIPVPGTLLLLAAAWPLVRLRRLSDT